MYSSITIYIYIVGTASERTLLILEGKKKGVD